jgi:membrane protease YdiL (CAAX protease family)
MLFYAKQHARIAAPVMIGLILAANLWANVRGIDLGQAFRLDLLSVILAALGLVLSASIDTTIYLLNWIIGFRPFLNAFDASFGKIYAKVGFPAIITGGLLAALGEETFFRGILFHEWGLLLSALVFAAAHAGRGLNLLTGWAFIEGLLFGWLYQVSGNLFVPMVVHGIHDAVGMFVGRYLYGRYLPPAPTLFDWLHSISQPPNRPVPANRTLVPVGGTDEPRAFRLEK